MRILPLLFFFFSILSFSQQLKTFEQERDSIIQKGINSYFGRDSIGLKKSINQLDRIYKEHQDSISLAKVYHYKALFFRITEGIDSIYYYYNQSKEISVLIKDSLEVGRRFLSLGVMQKGENDLVGAEFSYVEALKFLEPLKENRFTGNTYNNLGLVLIDFQQYEEARKLFKKSKRLHEGNQNENSKERAFLDYYNNTGFSYLREGDFDRAMIFFKEGLEYPKIKEKYPFRYQALLGNLSDCLHEIEKKDEAWNTSFELLNFKEKRNDIYGLSLSHNGIAFYYLEENKRKKALYHAKKGYGYAKEVNNNETILSSLLKLGELTSGAESKKYYKEYAQLSDSLKNRERNVKTQFSLIRYETEKKEKENEDLRRKNEIKEKEAESQRQQKTIYLLIGVLALITSITYFRNRRKKLLYEAQLQSIIVREDEKIRERNRISRELHDGVLSKLFGTRVSLGFLEFKDEKNKKQHQTLLNELQNIEKEIREVSHQLNKDVDVFNSGFKELLESLLEEKAMLGEFDFQLDFKEDLLEKEVPEHLKVELYRIVQEILQNVIKHSKAKEVLLKLSKEGKTLLILVKDDGIGFDLKNNNSGIGLKNIHSRVKKIKGTIEIFSEKNKGTEIRLRIFL